MNRIPLVLALVLVSIFDALAQAPFYQGKTIKIVAGYGAGSVDDAWARMIARHLVNIFLVIRISSSRTCQAPAR